MKKILRLIYRIYRKVKRYNGVVGAVFIIMLAALAGFAARQFIISYYGERGEAKTPADGEANKELEIEVEPVSAELFSKPSEKEEMKTFSHPKYGFSLDYPRELRVLTFDEGGNSETILFQHPTDRNKGFQIYVSPYDGDTPLTAKKIKEIQPFTRLDDVKNVSIAGSAAVLFWSATEVGQTREVWFVKDGRLYSVTTYASLDAWLSQIMSSWKFE